MGRRVSLVGNSGIASDISNLIKDKQRRHRIKRSREIISLTRNKPRCYYGCRIMHSLWLPNSNINIGGRYTHNQIHPAMFTSPGRVEEEIPSDLYFGLYCMELLFQTHINQLTLIDEYTRNA